VSPADDSPADGSPADGSPADDLADAIERVLPGWVVRSVVALAPGAGDAAREAGERARLEVVPQVRALLAADIDEQWTTPLALLRAAVRYPTDVLRAAGVPPVERDDFARDRFPDDVYNLTPASFADVDPALGDVGLVWGASKAFAHKQRHGTSAS
jgi:hypothetical protein